MDLFLLDNRPLETAVDGCTASDLGLNDVDGRWNVLPSLAATRVFSCMVLHLVDQSWIFPSLSGSAPWLVDPPQVAKMWI